MRTLRVQYGKGKFTFRASIRLGRSDSEAPPHLERHFRKYHGSSQKILQGLHLCYWRGMGREDLSVSGTILASHWCSFPGVFQRAYCQAVAVEASGGQQ